MEEFINEMLNIGSDLGRCINQKEIEETYEEARSLYKKHLEVINYSRCCKSEQLKDKKIKDLLNWVKSDLKQETNNKLSKTSTPYRTEKIRFLNKLLELQNI